MFENYVFSYCFDLKNDTVLGRKLKLIICNGLETISNISFNLLVEFIRRDLSEGEICR